MCICSIPGAEETGSKSVPRAEETQVGKKEGKRVFITHVKGTFLGMSESEEASKRR